MIEILAKVATNSEYTCGQIDNFVFSGMFPYVVSTVVMLIKIIVPILLIIFGMLDLAKAVIASKEDEIKKAQMTFVKRLIAAAIVFFVFIIVKLVISFVADDKLKIAYGSSMGVSELPKNKINLYIRDIKQLKEFINSFLFNFRIKICHNLFLFNISFPLFDHIIS